MNIDDIMSGGGRSTRSEIEGKILGEAIKALGSVPSGELYARVAAHLTLARYQAAIGYLKSRGDVTERAHLLTWTGR